MRRSFSRFLSKQAGRLVSVKSVLKIPIPVFLPFYHVVSDEDLPHILNYQYRDVKQFEMELDFYLRHFNPVSLEDLLNINPSNKKSFHITFDDGLRECAEIIAPILFKKGIPATFFINPSFVDNKALFHKYKASLILRKLLKAGNLNAEDLLKKNGLSINNLLEANIQQTNIIDQVAQILEIDFQDFLKNYQPYMTTNQIKDLQHQGFGIGAHSYHHPEFWQISDEQQNEEITSSMDWITKHFTPNIKSFAFPFTDSGVSKKILESIQHKNICDITFGTAGIKQDELNNHFQRYPVENSTDFIGDLKSELIYFQLRKIAGKATVKH